MNVLQILNRYNVEYVERGPNVAKGNVNIQCPWCGDDDRSQHLGINLEKGYWGCWRNKQHRGRKLYRLISKLTGLSYQEARRETGEGMRRAANRSVMHSAVAEMDASGNDFEASCYNSELFLPRNFRKIGSKYTIERKFIHYLHKDRLFNKADCWKLARRYKLHYAISGDFSDRVIIPVFENRKLMTYLGRSIYSDTALRYLALEKEKSVKQVKDCIYNYDRAKKGGKTLVIVEGAFDAMKIDFYNVRNKIRAVALFNMNVEDTQASLLIDLEGLFDEYVLILDRGEESRAVRLEDELFFLKSLKSVFLNHVKDPGDLFPNEAENIKEYF